MKLKKYLPFLIVDTFVVQGLPENNQMLCNLLLKYVLLQETRSDPRYHYAIRRHPELSPVDLHTQSYTVKKRCQSPFTKKVLHEIITTINYKTYSYYNS